MNLDRKDCDLWEKEEEKRKENLKRIKRIKFGHLERERKWNRSRDRGLKEDEDEGSEENEAINRMWEMVKKQRAKSKRQAKRLFLK